MANETPTGHVRNLIDFLFNAFDVACRAPKTRKGSPEDRVAWRADRFAALRKHYAGAREPAAKWGIGWGFDALNDAHDLAAELLSALERDWADTTGRFDDVAAAADALDRLAYAFAYHEHNAPLRKPGDGKPGAKRVNPDLDNKVRYQMEVRGQNEAEEIRKALGDFDLSKAAVQAAMKQCHSAMKADKDRATKLKSHRNRN